MKATSVSADRRSRAREQLVLHTYYVHSKRTQQFHFEIHLGSMPTRNPLILVTTDKAQYDYAAEIEGTDTRVDVWWVARRRGVGPRVC